MVNNNILLDKKVYVGPFIPRRVRAQQAEKSWTNVFIKDIDLAISDAELHQAFSQFGLVTSAVIMKKKDDGSSLGFGFVNFQDHESAGKAVDGMHQQKLGNKVLYCCRAQKRAERDAKLRKEWEQLKISKYQGINLYIKNIEDEIDEERLRKEFSAFGVIKSCKIMLDEKKYLQRIWFCLLQYSRGVSACHCRDEQPYLAWMSKTALRCHARAKGSKETKVDSQRL